MSVNGDYGVVLQLTEAALQASVDAFVASADQQFHHPIDRQIPLPEFNLREDMSWVVSLVRPLVQLEHGRTIALAIGVQVSGTAQTRLDPLLGGNVPSQPPTLSIAMSGRIAIEVGGVRTTVAGVPCLALNLAALSVTNFEVDLGNSDIVFSAGALQVISAVVRRAAVYILARQVGLIPLGFEFDVQIPILGELNIPVAVDYKVVLAGDGRRALAILLQVMNETVDWNQVGYAVGAGANFAILMSLGLIQYALNTTCTSLDGYRLSPNSGGLQGDLIFEDAHMRVQPGNFVLDGIKVQSSTLEKVEKVVETVICTALVPCNPICNKVFNTVIQWVQLDELAHASGAFSPCIDSGAFRVHAENIDVDISLPVKTLIFVAADALVPLGGFMSVVLMIIGHIFADRLVTRFIDNISEATVIDRPIPGTQLRFRAAATQIDWPDGSMALYGDFALEQG